MKRQLIFASLKGGVGKSYGARVFLDSARRAGRRISAWDLDGATGSLARRYPDRDPEVGAGTEDVRNPRAPGAWLDALYGGADDVLLDVPGGALGDLLRVIDGGAPALAAEAKAASRELVVVSVIGTQPDATETPQEAIERFGASVHHVVMKNGFFGAVDDFVIYDGIFGLGEDGKGRKYGFTGELVREIGGEVVYLPKLNPITDALLGVENLTFVEGIEALDLLGRRHTANVRSWLASAEGALTGSWLCPKGDVPIEVSSSKPGRRAAVAVAS